MSRRLAVLAALGPALVLGAALFSQYVGGLSPCQMCIWQRWPHGVAIALALIAVALGPGRLGAAALGLAAAALIVGVGLGGFHAGVELKFWEGPSTCSGGMATGGSAAEILAQIMEGPAVRCDEPAWVFLGVSMAGWNAILSLALAAFAAWAARTYSRTYSWSSASQ